MGAAIMNNAKISIIVPLYNVESYLSVFFEKLMSQTFQNFSILCVYDNSTDGTYRVLMEQVDKYPGKITVLEKGKKEGLGAARDYAMDSGLVNSKYVMFLDADDYPEPDFLEKLVNAADESDADITVCGFKRFDDETGKIYSIEMINNKNTLLSNVTADDTIAYMNPAVWNKLYRYELVKDLRFTTVKRGEDILYLIRMLPSIQSVCFINEALYHYRVRYDSLSNTITEKNFDEFLVLFCAIKDGYSESRENDSYLPLLELTTFIHIGIAFTYRVSARKNFNIHAFIKNTRAFMDREVPGWRKNRFINLPYSFKHRGIKGVALWSCRLLYKAGLFIIFIRLYNFMIDKLKVDKKW
jgi:glycosyltransferase involved in cell wall biosynthesis